VRDLKYSLSCIITALLGLSLTAAQTATKIRDGFLACAAMPSVSGRETQFTGYLKGQLPAGLRSETDNMGNLIVQVGDGNPQLLILTSIDEPGFLVTDITDDGFLRVASPGGRASSTLFYQFHEGHYVDIAAKAGMIRGVVALPSSHLVRGRRESLTLDRFLIDIGARSRQEAVTRGIEMLEPVTAVKDVAVLAENRVAGPMLGRKFGAFATLEALKAVGAQTGKSVALAWVTQSAMSNSGAARLARRFAPKRVVIVGAFQRGTGRTGRDPVEILDSGVLVPDADSPVRLRKHGSSVRAQTHSQSRYPFSIQAAWSRQSIWTICSS
jgi:putative aminopeptidase FrvX